MRSTRTPRSKVACQTRQIKYGDSHLLNFVDIIGRMADNVVGNTRDSETSPAIVVNEMALKGSVHGDGYICKEEYNIITYCGVYISNFFGESTLILLLIKCICFA